MSVEPVGRWVSPITSELITASSISLGAPQLAPNGEYIYWVEGRPTEKGRQVLCRQCAPAAASLTLLSCLLAPHRLSLFCSLARWDHVTVHLPFNRLANHPADPAVLRF
jgi:hypothetical protein